MLSPNSIRVAMAEQATRPESSLSNSSNNSSESRASRSRSPSPEQPDVAPEQSTQNSNDPLTKDDIEDLSDVDFDEGQLESENTSKVTQKEELSDFSDDEINSPGTRKDIKTKDLRYKIEEKKITSISKANGKDELENDEDALDFEAEEGECHEVVRQSVSFNHIIRSTHSKNIVHIHCRKKITAAKNWNCLSPKRERRLKRARSQMKMKKDQKKMSQNPFVGSIQEDSAPGA